MLKVSSLVGFAAALIATPLLGSPAWSAPCVLAPVATYTASGFSCNVDGVTFSNITIVPTITAGSGVLSFADIQPFSSGGESGLQLDFFASAGTSTNGTNTGQADFVWSYDVSGSPALVDVFMQLVGQTSGTGQIGVTEGLSNGVTLTLSGAGVTSASFPPIGSLHVIKDDFTLSGLNGFATQSALVNAFSVPGPIVGAGLPGMVAACGALLALARRRRQLVV
jgi:hypothetical protein